MGIFKNDSCVKDERVQGMLRDMVETKGYAVINYQTAGLLNTSLDILKANAADLDGYKITTPSRTEIGDDGGIVSASILVKENCSSEEILKLVQKHSDILPRTEKEMKKMSDCLLNKTMPNLFCRNEEASASIFPKDRAMTAEEVALMTKIESNRHEEELARIKSERVSRILSGALSVGIIGGIGLIVQKLLGFTITEE